MRRETDLSADSPLSFLKREGEREGGRESVADFDFVAGIVASLRGPLGLSSME